VVYTVESDEQGRLVIPAEVRDALNVQGKAHWQLEVQGCRSRQQLGQTLNMGWARAPSGHAGALAGRGAADARAQGQAGGVLARGLGAIGGAVGGGQQATGIEAGGAVG